MGALMNMVKVWFRRFTVHPPRPSQIPHDYSTLDYAVLVLGWRTEWTIADLVRMLQCDSGYAQSSIDRWLARGLIEHESGEYRFLPDCLDYVWVRAGLEMNDYARLHLPERWTVADVADILEISQNLAKSKIAVWQDQQHIVATSAGYQWT